MGLRVEVAKPTVTASLGLLQYHGRHAVLSAANRSLAGRRGWTRLHWARCSDARLRSIGGAGRRVEECSFRTADGAGPRLRVGGRTHLSVQVDVDDGVASGRVGSCSDSPESKTGSIAGGETRARRSGHIWQGSGGALRRGWFTHHHRT